MSGRQTPDRAGRAARVRGPVPSASPVRSPDPSSPVNVTEGVDVTDLAYFADNAHSTAEVDDAHPHTDPATDQHSPVAPPQTPPDTLSGAPTASTAPHTEDRTAAGRAARALSGPLPPHQVPEPAVQVAPTVQPGTPAAPGRRSGSAADIPAATVGPLPLFAMIPEQSRAVWPATPSAAWLGAVPPAAGPSAADATSGLSGRDDHAVFDQEGDPWFGGESGRPRVDWSVVAGFRASVATRLTRDAAGRLTDQQREDRGREFINDLITTHIEDMVSTGAQPWDVALQHAYERAVFDETFRLGRLQRFVDDPRIENIEIYGARAMFVQLTDGRLVEVEPITETDEDLISYIAHLASYAPVPRKFSPAHPSVHLRLAGGERLAASAWTTPEPLVVIRIHRLRTDKLGDLVGRAMITEAGQAFLSAALQADRSIVVSGAQGAGKTTLTRALCHEFPRWEHLATFETEGELMLATLLTDHIGRISSFEAQSGSTELNAAGRSAGEVTLSDQLIDSFRHNVDRQIVGEVRGGEIIAMIKAMQSSQGSLSTVHANNALGAVGKLITCALEAGPQITETYAARSIADAVDLIVQVTRKISHDPETDQWRQHRYVSEIIAIRPSQDSSNFGVGHTVVFTHDTANRCAVPNVLPEWVEELRPHGFAPEAWGFATAGTDS